MLLTLWTSWRVTRVFSQGSASEMMRTVYASASQAATGQEAVLACECTGPAGVQGLRFTVLHTNIATGDSCNTGLIPDLIFKKKSCWRGRENRAKEQVSG
jgi:hypothetical protein